MDDLISRKDLLKTIRDTAFDTMVCIDNGKLDIPHGWFKGMTTAESIIEEFPSAHSGTRWISCSERYPDMDGRVLVRTGYDKVNYHVWDCMMSNRGEDYFWEDEDGLYRNKYEVIDWMPLPE